MRVGGSIVVTGMWLAFASCGGPSGGSSQCAIEASNYDLSCSVDSDCVGNAGLFAVQFGNYCQSGCMCGGDAINKTSVAQYVHDVTPLTASMAGCFCPFVNTDACCANNRCTTSSCPPGGVDAGGPPAADAAPPGEPPGSFMCGLNMGPFDAGADAQGPWRWCTPPENCVPFNGAWACCILPEGGVTAGPSECAVPVDDAGR